MRSALNTNQYRLSVKVLFITWNQRISSWYESDIISEHRQIERSLILQGTYEES